jgi:hypothetical protein
MSNGVVIHDFRFTSSFAGAALPVAPLRQKRSLSDWGPARFMVDDLPEQTRRELRVRAQTNASNERICRNCTLSKFKQLYYQDYADHRLYCDTTPIKRTLWV